MTLLFLYLALAILVSFLCSILEAVLLSITPSYIESLKDSGEEMLQLKLSKLKNNVDKPLAAILSLNTIAHTIGAAGVGAQASKVFGSEYLGIVSAVLTLLILIFSEIIPKTIGANFWRNLDGFTANTLNVLILILYPLVYISMQITKLLSSKDQEARVSREELSAMADIGEQDGIFKKTESKMIKNLVALRSIKVEDIMTPRTVMVMAQEDLTLKEARKSESFTRFSRIPVFKKNRDDIVGYVHKLDLLTMLADDKHEHTLKEIKRDVLVLMRNVSLPAALDQLMQNKDHIALVTDKYGAVAGLVTMEDIIETLLGNEIMDEFDSVEDMQDYARQQWRERAKKLGLLVASAENSEEGSTDKNSDDVIKLGITGGKAPE